MKRAALWAVLIVATLAAVEGACRLAYPLWFGTGFDARAVHTEQRERMATPTALPGDVRREEVLHPYLGYVSNPASANALANALRGIGVSDWGLNDDKSPIQNASPKRVVIGIFGGSVAHYLSLQGLSALSEALEAAPRFHDRELVVVRVALAGWKQPQQLFALSYLLALGAHFDVVVNLDGFNEVALPGFENRPHGVFPFFPRNWFARTQGYSDRGVRLAIGEIAYLEDVRARWAARCGSPAVGWSAAMAVLWRLRDRALAADVARAQRELATRRDGDARYVATGPPYDYGQGTLVADLVAVWARSSLQMQQLAAANGIEYFHFLQPNQYVPDAKPLHEIERRDAWSASSPHREGVEAGYPGLVEMGQTLVVQGVAFHDLSRIFADHPEPLYSDACCHLNDRGNALLAERIGEIIATSPRP